MYSWNQWTYSSRWSVLAIDLDPCSEKGTQLNGRSWPSVEWVIKSQCLGVHVWHSFTFDVGMSHDSKTAWVILYKNCFKICKSYIQICKKFIIRAHDSVSLLNQSAQPINTWLHISDSHYFYSLKTLLGMLVVKQREPLQGKQTGTLQGAFGWPSCSFPHMHTHTFVFAERNSDSYTLLIHTSKHRHKHVVPCLETSDLNLLLSLSNT